MGAIQVHTNSWANSTANTSHSSHTENALDQIGKDPNFVHCLHYIAIQPEL